MANQIASLVDAGLAQVHDTTRGSRPSLADLLASTPEDARAAYCGPAAMLSDFGAATANWPAERVHLELFVRPPLVPDREAFAHKLVLAQARG